MGTNRVYISSTLRDLEVERRELIELLEWAKYGREFCEKDEPQEVGLADYCRDRVRSCDAYVLIVAWRYGFVPPDMKVSITEHELLSAIERRDELARSGVDFPVFVYTADERTAPKLGRLAWLTERDAARERKRAMEFRQRISGPLKFTPRVYSSSADLGRKVLAHLRSRFHEGDAPAAIDSDLLLTLDRQPHATSAQGALPDPAPGPHLPKVLLVYGRDRQGHNVFTRRLARHEFQRPSLRDARVTWVPHRVPAEGARLMHRELAGKLSIGAPADDVDLLARVAQYPHPVFVRTEMGANPWTTERRDQLRAYVTSWFRPEVLERYAAPFFVTIEVRQPGDVVEKDLDEIRALAEVRGRVASVLELSNVETNEFRDWIESSGLLDRLGYGKADELVERVFGKEKAGRPFEDLVTEVSKAYAELQP